MQFFLKLTLMVRLETAPTGQRNQDCPFSAIDSYGFTYGST